MKERKHSINKKILNILIIFAISIFLLTGYVFAKNISQILIKTETEIAEPILVVENGDCIQISSPKNSGIYTFKVKNYNEEQKLTDVNLKYKISIKSRTESLKFKLYHEEKQIELINNETDNILISNKEKEEREYRLEIIYDKNSNQKIEDIVDQIQLKVHSEQVKG